MEYKLIEEDWGAEDEDDEGTEDGEDEDESTQEEDRDGGTITSTPVPAPTLRRRGSTINTRSSSTNLSSSAITDYFPILKITRMDKSNREDDMKSIEELWEVDKEEGSMYFEEFCLDDSEDDSLLMLSQTIEDGGYGIERVGTNTIKVGDDHPTSMVTHTSMVRSTPEDVDEHRIEMKDVPKDSLGDRSSQMSIGVSKNTLVEDGFQPTRMVTTSSLGMTALEDDYVTRTQLKEGKCHEESVLSDTPTTEDGNQPASMVTTPRMVRAVAEDGDVHRSRMTEVGW